MDWEREITEQHDLFDSWFRDGTGSFDRFAETMDPSFTIISPSGEIATAAQIVEVVRSGRGRAPTQTITTSDHQLIAESADLLVARYIEHHATSETSRSRCSTVVFRRDADAPNGLRWVTVHETWVPPTS